MNRIVDDHQAGRDAEMLARRAEDASCGSEAGESHRCDSGQDDTARPSETNLAPLSTQTGLLMDAAWDECISDDDWIGKR